MEALASITGPQVVIGSRNPFPAMPSTSQRYFFTDADAGIEEHGGSGFPSAPAEAFASGGDNFSYGKPNRAGTQSAYIPVPHHCARPCPGLSLPTPLPGTTVTGAVGVPHPCLAVNELALSVRVVSAAALAELCPSSRMARPRGAVQWAREPLVNLETANYLLAGIQRHVGAAAAGGPGGWDTAVWRGLGLDAYTGRGLAEAAPIAADSTAMEALCTHVVRSCIRPLGVVVSCEFNANSEQVSLVVDGEVRNLEGLWPVSWQRYPRWRPPPALGAKRPRPRAAGASAPPIDAIEPGDCLALALRLVEAGEAQCTFFLPRATHTGGAERLRFTGVQTAGGEALWQLVPVVHSGAQSSRGCWDGMGFWHVGVLRGTPGVGVYDPGESGRLLGREECEEWAAARLLHATIAPEWVDGIARGDDWGGAFIGPTPAAPLATSTPTPPPTPPHPPPPLALTSPPSPSSPTPAPAIAPAVPAPAPPPPAPAPAMEPSIPQDSSPKTPAPPPTKPQAVPAPPVQSPPAPSPSHSVPGSVPGNVSTSPHAGPLGQGGHSAGAGDHSGAGQGLPAGPSPAPPQGQAGTAASSPPTQGGGASSVHASDAAGAPAPPAEPPSPPAPVDGASPGGSAGKPLTEIEPRPADPPPVPPPKRSAELEDPLYGGRPGGLATRRMSIFSALDRLGRAAGDSVRRIEAMELMSPAKIVQELNILRGSANACVSSSQYASEEIAKDVKDTAKLYMWAVRCMARAYRDERRLGVEADNEACRSYSEVLRKARALGARGDPGGGVLSGDGYWRVENSVENELSDVGYELQFKVEAPEASGALVASAMEFQAAVKAGIATMEGKNSQRSKGFWTQRDNDSLLKEAERLQAAQQAARGAYEDFEGGMRAVVDEYASWRKEHGKSLERDDAEACKEVEEAMLLVEKLAGSMRA